MKPIVIFDMDGTLFKTHLILEPALDETFAWLRTKGLWKGATPIDTYREIMGVPLPVVWQTLCPEHSAQQHEASNQHFQQALIDMIVTGRGALYEEAIETLGELSILYDLHIASNGNLPYLEAIVSTYQLDRFLSTTNSIDRIASGNKSELVASVVHAAGSSSGYVVGDRLSDIRAAQDNGLTSIGVRFDFAQEEELAQADHVVESFSELYTLLL